MNRGSTVRARRVPTTLFSCIFLLLALVAPVLAASDKDTIDSVTRHAQKLALTGHIEEAVALLQSSLAVRPKDLNARLALARIYGESGRNDQAEQEFRKALQFDPLASAAELALGTFYIKTGSLPAAEQILEGAVRHHPKLNEARQQLALVLARERKYAEAEASIRSVPPPLGLDDRVRYFRLVASIQSALGDSQAAAHSMEAALQVKPDDEELQLLTAFAEAQAGDWLACIRNVAPLYEKHPGASSGLLLLRAQLGAHQTFTSTLQNLRALTLPEDQKLDLRARCAEALASADKHADAVEELQEAVKLTGGGDDTLLYNLAVEQYSAGQFDATFSTLAPLRDRKDSAEIEDLLGDVEEQRGRRPAAVHNHEQAIALAPEEERYRLSLGAELLKFGDYQRAVSVFQQAAAGFPNSARMYVGLGMAYYFTENNDQSVAAFLRADKLDGGSGRVLAYLGSTQVDNATGPAPAAVEAICSRADASTGSNAGQSAAVLWCGALLFRSAYLAGDQSAAPDVLPRLRMAVKLAPHDAVANCSLGRALEWTEHPDEARHWLEICVQMRPDSAEDHYRLSRVYQSLGLKKEAAKQSELTDKANAERDQHQALADRFAQEVLNPSKANTDPK